MAEEKIVKIQNIGGTPLPVHQPGADSDCIPFGCEKCSVPTWNRIEFPMKKDEILVVKENVGRHLEKTFHRRIKVIAGPFDTTALLQSPEGFFQFDPVTGRFATLEIRTGTSATGGPQDAGAEGERIEDVKRKGRFLARGET